jgi:large subunit ribosomal protein L21
MNKKYAIIETGSKQYKVEEGDELDVELLKHDGEYLIAGAPYAFEKVLLINDGTNAIIGAPVVPNCKVTAEVLGKAKGPKVIAFKFTPCKNYRRTVGHRQKYSRVRIKEIVVA